MRLRCSRGLALLALCAALRLAGSGPSHDPVPGYCAALDYRRARARHHKGPAPAAFAGDPLAVLRLRGGKGPAAKLKPDKDDLRVHYPSKSLVKPHHMCLKSALHRRRLQARLPAPHRCRIVRT